MLLSQKNYEVYKGSRGGGEWGAGGRRGGRGGGIHSKITNKCFDNIRIITIFAR